MPVVVDDFSVVADGRLVPKDSVQLSFVTNGQVAEVLVEEGDLVEAGDVIARLGDREQLEANIANAELDRTSAEFELVSAQTELLNAEQSLEELYENWPTAATQAQEALKDARQEVHDTERRLNNLNSTAQQFDIDTAWSQVVLAEKAMDDAEEKFEPYANKPEDNLMRANFQQKLAEAQKAHDAAVRRYNAVKGTANEFDVSQAEDSYTIAQARLEQAQEDYDQLLEGPDPDEIAIAEARIETTKVQITTIEERIKTADANILAAQTALDNLELVATIDGTVVELELIIGEQVSPGQLVVRLVDFSEWYVETDNLTEIEVVDVAVGQAVTIVPDSLPEEELNGVVESISDIYTEKGGDITYTARILVDQIDPRLRWGMTVVVTFVEE
jgi:HlyD family secretion protein